MHDYTCIKDKKCRDTAKNTFLFGWFFWFEQVLALFKVLEFSFSLIIFFTLTFNQIITVHSLQTSSLCTQMLLFFFFKTRGREHGRPRQESCYPRFEAFGLLGIVFIFSFPPFLNKCFLFFSLSVFPFYLNPSPTNILNLVSAHPVTILSHPHSKLFYY